MLNRRDRSWNFLSYIAISISVAIVSLAIWFWLLYSSNKEDITDLKNRHIRDQSRIDQFKEDYKSRGIVVPPVIINPSTTTSTTSTTTRQFTPTTSTTSSTTSTTSTTQPNPPFCVEIVCIGQP